MPYQETKQLPFDNNTTIEVTATDLVFTGAAGSQTSLWSAKPTTTTVPQKGNIALLSFISDGGDNDERAIKLYGYHKNGNAELMLTATVIAGVEVGPSGGVYCDGTNGFDDTLWLNTPTKSENAGVSRLIIAVDLMGVSELLVFAADDVTSVEVTYV